MNDVRTLLRRAMRHRKITKYDLAKKLNMEYRVFNRFWRKPYEQINVSTICIIAHALGLEIRVKLLDKG